MLIKKIFTNKLAIPIIFFLCIIIGYVAGFIGYNQFGIYPRTFSLESIYGIAMSWTMHGDWNHLRNNLLILIQLIIPFVIFEKQVQLLKKFWQLVFVSGCATWILGGNNTIHIGASGLIFALIGYILSTGTYTVFNLLRFKITKENLKSLQSGNKYDTMKGFIYFGLSCFAILELGYLQSILNGLFPQSSDGISLSAHFGGLIGGVLVGWLNSKSKS